MCNRSFFDFSQIFNSLLPELRPLLLFTKPQRSAGKDVREEDPKKPKIDHELINIIEKLLVIKTNISKVKSR